MIDIFISTVVSDSLFIRNRFLFFVKLNKHVLYPITWRWDDNQVFTWLNSDPFTNHFSDDAGGLEAAAENESAVRVGRAPFRPSVDVSLQVASVQRVGEVSAQPIVETFFPAFDRRNFHSPNVVADEIAFRRPANESGRIPHAPSHGRRH